MKFRALCKILIIAVVVVPSAVIAMSSENYEIGQDSISFSGSDGSTSANYTLDDTMGEIATGFMHSTLYFAGIGYRRMVVAEPSISFTISDSSLDLGTLSVFAVNSDSHTFSVTTNATQGYVVKVYEDTDFKLSDGGSINDVVDGEVTAGSEEYGIRTSGDDGQYNSSDTAITNGKTVANNSVPVTSQETQVTYKAAIDYATSDGVYSHNVYYVVSGTF